jgi:hypothetical protein
MDQVQISSDYADSIGKELQAIYKSVVVRYLHLKTRDSKSLESVVTISGIRALARFPRQPAKAPESHRDALDVGT